MPNDPKQPVEPEDLRLQLARTRDLSDWAKQLGVTREELRSALETAGAMVKDLRAER